MPGKPIAAHTALPACRPADITAWRMRLKLSTREAARRIGVTQRAVNQWEAGDRMPWYLGAVLHYIECQNTDARSHA